MPDRDGFNYAPSSQTTVQVVQPGEFVFATAFLEHGHIHGQMKGLLEAGGRCKWVFDTHPERAADFAGKYPGTRVAQSLQQILDDPQVMLVSAAAVPSERAGIGLRVLRAGKDYFTDKAPFTSLHQLEEVRRVAAETGRKYMCYYSERIHSEAAMHAVDLVRQGAVGRVLQVLILAPHNLAAATRPSWFFQKEYYGGILTDIGSHQCEQFLTFTGARDGRTNFARVDNFANPDTPELEDFGEISMTMDNGASCYCRLDWFNPPGLRTWGDGRTFILGTGGSIEVRKYIELASDPFEEQVIYLVDKTGEHRISCTGRTGYPFFGKLILDVLNRTENAMTQEHCFKAAELSLRAQAMADNLRSASR